MAVASGFKDLDYSQFCKKLERIEEEIEGWDLSVDSYGTKIYKRYIPSFGLNEYRVIGSLKNVAPDTCFHVYADIGYRKKWDIYVKELYNFEEDLENAIYWEMKYPFPLNNRDYTYRLKTAEFESNGKQFYLIHAYSFDSKTVASKKGVLRVTDYHQVALFTADEFSGTTVYMEYFENPGSTIPPWLINWAAKNGIPDFLTICEQACLGYDMYLSAN